MILNFRFQPHKADTLTTPSGSPLHRGRDGRKKSYQCFNVAHPPPVQGGVRGGSRKFKI